MGTRGFVTFVVDGEEKTAYNHYDSYPSGLGVEVLAFARMITLTPELWEAARQAARDLIVVDDRNTAPNDEQIARLREYADTGVGEQTLTDWYVLLRRTQGNAAAILDAGYVIDASDFPADSLFAEWGYVIDFDNELFEAYEGFQEHDHSLGRFAGRRCTQFDERGDRPGGSTYYPVALAEFWSLDGELPTNEQFVAALERYDANDQLIRRDAAALTARFAAARKAVATSVPRRAITAS